jgi:hypothetical protein
LDAGWRQTPEPKLNHEREVLVIDAFVHLDAIAGEAILPERVAERTGQNLAIFGPGTAVVRNRLSGRDLQHDDIGNIDDISVGRSWQRQPSTTRGAVSESG